MARYKWTQRGGGLVRSMGLGTFEGNITTNRTITHTYDGQDYTLYQGYLDRVTINTLPPAFFSSNDGISEVWFESGVLSTRITATGTNEGGRRPSVSYYNIYVDNVRFDLQGGQSYGSDTDKVLYLIALRGAHGQTDGVYLTYMASGDNLQSFSSQYIFVPLELFDMAVKQNPYETDMDETKAGDPSEDGGYGAGFPDGDPAKTDTTKGSIFPFGSGLHAYVITPAQLATLSSFLWGRVSTVFDPGGLWAKFQNYKFNPIAGVLTCHSLPLALMPASGGSATIAIAGTDLSGASGAPCSTHFTKYTSDFVSIPEPYASFVDYAYPSFAIHIPFCGVVPIDVSAIMGGGVYVRIFCDVVSGNVGAWIIGVDRSGNEQLLKVATGNCAYQVPITGNDNGTGEIVGSLKQAVAGGFSGNAPSMLSAGFNIVSGLQKHNTETVGSYCGNVGYCGSEEIFLICNWAYPVYTDYYSRERGRPSEYSGTVGSFSGYAELEVHADSISVATDEERQEIENVLRSGVII